MCKYLSLRGSQFIDFQVDQLHSLEFIDIRETNIINFDLKSCSQLRLVIADSSQNVIVNDDVEVIPFTFPAAAPNGIMDTQSIFGQETVSFGDSDISSWVFLILADSTNVEFVNAKLGYDKITDYDWRNLTHTLYLNLYLAHKVQSINVNFLKSIRLLIIWWSGIKSIDLTKNETLELIVCGNATYENGWEQQDAIVRMGVEKRVFNE